MRKAPVLSTQIGGEIHPGMSLGPSRSLPKALTPAAHRPPPAPPPEVAAARNAPAAPRLAPQLRSSVTTREIAYRTQATVERMVGEPFIKFDVVGFRSQTLPTSNVSVEDRMARALELAASKRMWDHVHSTVNYGVPQAQPWRPPPRLPVENTPYLDQSKQFSYFPGLRSQQPSSRITIYFLKVEAAWSGGFGHLHLRIRTIPPERTPLGVPCAIPPETEHRLVLEGVLSNLEASSPIEPFDANMSTLVNPPSDHWARRRRTGATF